MRQGLLQEDALAARHLALDGGRRRVLGAEPHQVERVLPGSAVTGHRDDVGEGDRVLPRVVERGDALRREVLRDREGLEGGRDTGSATGPRSFSR